MNNVLASSGGLGRNLVLPRPFSFWSGFNGSVCFPDLQHVERPGR